MISELFENIKVYGHYIRSNNLDGLEYWNKIKSFLARPEQKNGLVLLNNILGSEWDIEIKFHPESVSTNDLNLIYDYVHDELKMYGEERDDVTRSLDHETWEKYHFFLQLIRVPKNNSLNLLRLLQIGYNLGQLSLYLHTCGDIFTPKVLEYYNLNDLDNLNSYVKLSGEQSEQIDSGTEISDLVENLNHFILSMVTFAQTGGNGDIEPFYSDNIEILTKQNNDYRRVLYTGLQQFVLMSIPPHDDIKMEIHKDHDQFIRIEQGEGEAIIGTTKYDLKKNTGLIVPAGTQHQIINNSSTESLKLYTIYSPSEHPDKLVQQTNPDKLLSEDDYMEKYLKYKNKYMELKKSLKNTKYNQ